DGIIPGFFGYEAGQSAVGDIFAWFTKQAVPPEVHEQARRDGSSVHAVLEREAGRLRPGENGLLALDWWNGNRSILVDAELSGLLVGATLATRPADIYRALLEATAFGARTVIDSLEAAGLPSATRSCCSSRRTSPAASSRWLHRRKPRHSARRCTARWRRAPQPAAATRSPTRPRAWFAPPSGGIG